MEVNISIQKNISKEFILQFFKSLNFVDDISIISDKNENEESETNKIEEELSPELKQLLISRLDDYKKNPENVVTWEEMELDFKEKYGNEI